MRPQPEGRGELNDRHQVLTEDRGLQCGHSPKAVENAAYWKTLTKAQQASMRPQPEGRGERQPIVPVSGGAEGASMRPQPEGRGEHGGAVFAIPLNNWLQCGHSPKAVENHL